MQEAANDVTEEAPAQYVPFMVAVLEFAQQGVINDMSLVNLHEMVNVDDDKQPCYS